MEDEQFLSNLKTQRDEEWKPVLEASLTLSEVAKVSLMFEMSQLILKEYTRLHPVAILSIMETTKHGNYLCEVEKNVRRCED